MAWRGGSLDGVAARCLARRAARRRGAIFCMCFCLFFLQARNTGTLAQPPFLITTARLSFRNPPPSSLPHGLKKRRRGRGGARRYERGAAPPPRRAGRRPAAAPLVVVLLGRGVENARRRRHSRVVCVRNPADCEVKSGALLRWRSPQALAMSHLRGFGFARDRNHQKRHVRSEVSHMSCIARALGATPSETRPT